MATARIQTILRNKPFGTFIQTDVDGKLSLGNSDASIGSVIVSSINNNNNFIGTVASLLRTDAVSKDGYNNADIYRSIVSLYTSGSNVIVNAFYGSKIRVLGGLISFSAPVTLIFKSNFNTPITGSIFGGERLSIPLPFTPYGHFETATSASLTVYLDTSGSIGGYISYIKV